MTQDAVGTPELVEAARRAFDVLEQAGARYALIGGIAVARHGILRPTRDIDLLLAVEKIRLPSLLEAFRSAGFAFEPGTVIRAFTQDGMSQIAFGRTPLDLLAPVLPYFADVLNRARREPILGREPFVAIPEDVVVMKAIAMRSGDRQDIEGILAAQAGRLDLEAIRRGADALLSARDPKRSEVERLLGAHNPKP